MNTFMEQDDVTREIIGACFEVLNVLGCGLLEKPYENALAYELESRGLSVEQQKQFDVIYKDQKVGFYVPDLIVSCSVIVDTKTIDKIGDLELAQMLNYLKLCGLNTGLIVNFKRPKLEWKRVVLNP